MLQRVILNLPVFDLFVASGAFLPGQLMYLGVGEPVTVAAQRQAMTVTVLYYAAVGLPLACFGYRYNLPLVIRSVLCPLL